MAEGMNESSYAGKYTTAPGKNLTDSNIQKVAEFNPFPVFSGIYMTNRLTLTQTSQ